MRARPLAALFIALSALGCGATVRPEPRTTTPAANVEVIRVFFPGPDEPYRDCAAHLSVARVIPLEGDPIAAALAALLAGPTPRESEAAGVYSPFLASVADPSTPALSFNQVKATRMGNVVTVDFAPPAATYLQQAECARHAVTSAIENTLLQLPGVGRVEFAIGGQSIEEWDA
ncbi:MAG: GerMN domain-containing protein [Polyangiaceae bacterium]